MRQEQIDHEIEVTPTDLSADTQRSGQACGIRRLSLMVSEHGPVPAQHFTRYTEAQRRGIALKVGSHEIEPPREPVCAIVGLQAVRKSAAMPENIRTFSPGYPNIQRLQLAIRHSPGQ